MTKIETENLLALLQGIDLTDHQKGLAINEYNRLVIRINELERKLRQFSIMESDCDHEWLDNSFDHFGFLKEQICDKCGAKQSVI